MGGRLSPLGSAFGLSLAFVCGAAVARPATVKDLAGRTVCYNNGEKATYFRDGEYESNTIGKGTWRVTSAGVQLSAERYTGILDFEISPDKSISIASVSMTGNDCK
jgi:hypothetical protein